MARCSIVIPVYNRSALTRRCLDGLLAAPETRNQELIVVDDCSGDDTAEVLAGYGGAIRVIRHETNMGYGQGVNDGTALASEGYVVHLNNDTVPVTGWLDALCRYADEHPGAAAVSSKLLNADGSVQHAGIVFCSERRPWHLYRWFPADHPAVYKSRRFQAVTGTSLLVRKDAFHQAGGFDASYRNSFNDVDFCLRLGELGYEVHFCHDSVLYHLEGASKTGNASDSENCRRLVARWGHRIREDEWDYYVQDGLLQIRRHNDQLEFVVAPVLGRVSPGGAPGEVEELLLRQSQQIALLMREYIALRLNAGAATGTDLLCPEAPSVCRNEPAHAGNTLAAHERLAQLAARVLDHDAVRAERDALRERVDRFRDSLPGRLFLKARGLLKRTSA